MTRPILRDGLTPQQRKEATDDLCRTVDAAQRLARIYFEIAVEAIGEEAVRRKRDERITTIGRGCGIPRRQEDGK